MSSNIHEFNLGLRHFAERSVPDAVGDFRDALALEALRGVALLSPVKTGRLRGNWQVTISAPAEGHDPNKKDPSPNAGQVISEGARVIASAERQPFEPIWLHNGVPYAGYVNGGTPKVTAVRMVERTVERLKRAFGGR